MALVYISVGSSQQVYTLTSASLPLVYIGGERSRKGLSKWQSYVNIYEAHGQGCARGCARGMSRWWLGGIQLGLA